VSDEQRHDSGLVWAVHRPFAQYVSALSDGTIELADGCGTVAESGYFFSPDPSPDGAQDATLRFRGQVAFRAHSGLLEVRVADPILRMTTPTGGALFVNGADDTRFALVDFSLTEVEAGDRFVRAAAETFLTVEGTRLFDGVYPDAQPFAPLEVRVPRQQWPGEMP
jgi:hypothetical protein